MQHIEGEACHERAWACLRAADHEHDKGRRAILVSAAYTWETLAREIDEAADREVEHMNLAGDGDESWLLVEIARALAARRAVLASRPGLPRAASLRPARRRA